MTASIGSGHIKAAEAVEAELRKQYPQDEVLTVDFMSEETSWFNGFLKRLYLRMLAFVPNLYDVCYKVSGAGSSGVMAQNMFAVTMYRTMKRILKKYQPDILVCTHPFPEGAAALCKRMGMDGFRIAAVLTDYSLHQIWIYPQVDFYFTATEEMRDGLVSMGFSKERVISSGIAVDSNAARVPGRSEARKRLGVLEDEKVVLLMGGGLGLGGIKETLEELERVKMPLRILTVAGHNEELKQQAEEQKKRSRHEIDIWGYTNEIGLLMAVSDVLVTKPGALTMSEAFVMGLPMLLREPIPGPETENAVYASCHGAAVWVHHGESLAYAAEQVLSAPSQLAAMREAALSCARPQAAEVIARHLGNMPAQ